MSKKVSGQLQWLAPGIPFDLYVIDLDFMDLVKLVNYVRTKVREGQGLPKISTRDIFQDDRWLKPVLEDDALLYSLGDLTLEEDNIEKSTTNDVDLHRPNIEIARDPEAASLRLDQYEKQIHFTEDLLLKSTQQLDLTQKALERVNALMDQAKLTIDEQSRDRGTQGSIRGPGSESSDDPYRGICKSYLVRASSCS